MTMGWAGLERVPRFDGELAPRTERRLRATRDCSAPRTRAATWWRWAPMPLTRLAEAWQRVKMLWQHDPGRPIGV
jgi:hypothetical protein